MKPLIEKALASLEKPLAMRVFFLVSFLESALLPIPVESLSIPLLTARKNPWPIAFWGTVSSVLGGITGYLIGFALFGTVGQWLIGFYGVEDQYAMLQERIQEKGAAFVLMGAVLPIPFKLVSIACGTIQFPFLAFLLVATIGRAFRYAAFAAAFHFFGDQIRTVIHKRPRLMSGIILAVMIAGFVFLFF